MNMNVTARSVVCDALASLRESMIKPVNPVTRRERIRTKLATAAVLLLLPSMTSALAAVCIARPACATTLPPPGPVVTMTPQCGGWLLDWTPIEGATEYVLSSSCTECLFCISAPGPWCEFASVAGPPYFVPSGVSIQVPVWVRATLPEGPTSYSTAGSWEAPSPPLANVLLPVETSVDPALPLTLCCAATPGISTYQWSRNGRALPAGNTIRVLQPGEYQIGDVISCLISNPCGEIFTTTTIVDGGEPSDGLVTWLSMQRAVHGDKEHTFYQGCAGLNCGCSVGLVLPFGVYSNARNDWSTQFNDLYAGPLCTVLSELSPKQLTFNLAGKMEQANITSAFNIAAGGARLVVTGSGIAGSATINLKREGVLVGSVTMNAGWPGTAEIVLLSGAHTLELTALPTYESVNIWCAGFYGASTCSLPIKLEFQSLGDCNGNGSPDGIDIERSAARPG